MKAYMVHDGEPLEGCTLVYADNASRAKAVAYTTGWYDEYHRMRAVRKPDFDKYSDGTERCIECNSELSEGVVFFSDSSDQ